MIFEASRRKMLAAGLLDWQIKRFEADFRRLQQGQVGFLSESHLCPLGPLPQATESLPDATDKLAQTLVIKLNGGLGTSMGLEGPKSLLEIRPGQSFLGLTLTQIEHLRRRSGAQIPLLLMNSFHTRRDSLALLRARGFDNAGQDLDFLQSKVPKLRIDSLEPVSYPENPSLEWCPPGHGEIYSAMVGWGLLEQLLSAGYRYAFVSNVDNLGASLDLKILHWFTSQDLDFAMEVTRRTELDRKGGHLAQTVGGLCLRERAQCAPEDLPYFEDIQRHQFFNTNNLWLRLEALKEHPQPELPLILNRKSVDPTRPDSTPVYQLESAMGAAISHFPRSAALEVPRTRFLPVKTLADLLLLRSDLYRLDPDGCLHFQGEQLPHIQLDARYFGNYSDFQERFQQIPSLLQCHSLRVDGDVHFRESLQLAGHVHLAKPER